MPYLEPGIPQITFIDPNDFINNDDRQCVADCDANDVNNDEEWWNACIDQCLDNSRNKQKITDLYNTLQEGNESCTQE